MNVQSPLPGIPELTLQRHSDISLVDQIVQAIQQQIQNRLLKPGARLLSVGNCGAISGQHVYGGGSLRKTD
jgi:DNA-binding transcriptional regulator YhcF (GntR family)